MMLAATKGRKKAFTFIELLIVVVILGIFIRIAIPSFRKTFQNQQLKIFTQELQSLINYLHGRSIVEERIVYLSIDNEKKEYGIGIKGNSVRLKTYQMPSDIKVVAEAEEILFYPDGSIDPVNLTISNLGQEGIILTTKGVFGGAKISSQK